MENLYILALHLQKGIGPKTIRKILSVFGSIEEAITRKGELREVVGPVKASHVLSADRKRAEEELLRARKLNVKVVTLLNEDYPEKLRHYDNMPVVLYVMGDPTVLNEKAVAIVGTRYPGEDAKRISFEMGKRLAEAGVVVVSGGAYGIDTHAHRGALAGGGRTVVVLGSGMDRPYPRENLSLFKRIVEGGGAIVSEFPLGTPPNQGNFPARNRVISALSDAVVVVQAPSRSGALITASWALDQGKDVWAVPFSPLDKRAYGSNRLLFDGAKPVYDIDHFVEDVTGGTPQRVHRTERKDVDEAEAFVLDLLKEPLHIDEIVYRTGFPMARIYSLLLTLQMKGYVRELPGKLYEAIP